MAIIIPTLAILGAILVPNLGSLNRFARSVKVKEDLQVLCTALEQYFDDTGESAFYEQNDLGGTPDHDGHLAGLLVGDGDLPDAGADPDSDDWRLPAERAGCERSQPVDG